MTHVVRIEDFAFSGATLISKGEIAFGECLEFVGSSAFLSSGANGTVTIPANCTLNYRSFNGTSFEFVCIKVAKGETKSLPQELFSGASGGLTLVIDGSAVANANHVFSGNSMTVYMPTVSDIQGLVSTAAQKSGNERLGFVTFYSCEDGHKYTSSKTGELTDKGEAEEVHIYTAEPVHFPADCSHYERYAYVCYCCGNESVVSQGSEYGNHDFRVSIKLPTCQSNGYREYACRVCSYKESAHVAGQVSHNASVFSYELNGYATVTVTTSCSDCKQVVSTENVSLVNKCYIEGYGLFDATLEYVSVSADGVATPNSAATFDKAVIYFPSFAEIDGEIVEVKTVQGFKALSIGAIYIPDTVTRLVGGANVGCFGDVYDLTNVVVGSGVTVLESEVFCMGRGVKLNEFIFKGVITRIEKFALKTLSESASDIPYEFNTDLSYVGYQVNLSGNIIREVRIAKDCDLSEKFAFNNANGLLTVYIEGGDTPETALDLGQEFTSNTCTRIYYIKGYVTVSGQAVLSGMNDTRIYMESTDAIDVFANAIKAQNYKDRINKAVFFDCETGKAWYVPHNAERSEHTSVPFTHGGVVTEVGATCTQNGSVTESCFVCGSVVSSTVTDMLAHDVDGGVITVMPTLTDSGIIVYTCITCGDAEEVEIPALSESHSENVMVAYPNGYTEKGMVNTFCTLCDFAESRETAAMVEMLGFSLKEDMSAITYGYKLDMEAIKFYESMMGDAEIGFIIANAGDVEAKGLLDGEFNVLKSVRGAKILIYGREYSYVEVKLVGLNTEELRMADFLLALYVVADSDNNGERDISFLQQSFNKVDNKPVTVGDCQLNTASIERAYKELN